MSSEMRELAEEGLAYFERSGDAGDKKYVEAIRALLARTEAGADGDKAGWQDGWPMAYHTRYRHVLEETIGQPFGEGTRLGSADIRRVAMAMAREFGVPTDTRPQDASGDAVAELIAAADVLNTGAKHGLSTYPEDWKRLDAALDAMQAKEAK